jgi:hypothetical protein
MLKGKEKLCCAAAPAARADPSLGAEREKESRADCKRTRMCLMSLFCGEAARDRLGVFPKIVPIQTN